MLTEQSWWQRTPPLNDTRDVMARIGFRFVWCTAPFFAFALACAAFGDTRLLLNPLAIIPLAIPIAGGILDWQRLRSKPIPHAAP